MHVPKIVCLIFIQFNKKKNEHLASFERERPTKVSDVEIEREFLTDGNVTLKYYESTLAQTEAESSLASITQK